jgi:nitrate/TMAO reductase-like tetraheme cytochrome c subunit
MAPFPIISFRSRVCDNCDRSYESSEAYGVSFCCPKCRIPVTEDEKIVRDLAAILGDAQSGLLSPEQAVRDIRARLQK